MNRKNNPILKSSSIRVGLCIGDPAGIGPALTLKVSKLLKNKVDLTVIGNSFVLAKTAKMLKNYSWPEKLIDLDNVKAKNFSFGKLRAQNGQASIQYLDKTLELLKSKEIDCLVTCPVSKEAVNLSGINFSGHTEYLAKKTKSKNLVMMLINDKLKFSLATRHIALKDVSRLLSQGTLENNIIQTCSCLRSYFLIKKPKIIVCALNPHASDNGLLGDEEIKIINPAIRKIKREFKNIYLTNAISADIAIAQAASGLFDAVIAIYHDQALIPLKLTDAHSGVNLTFGLPFVRTSPLHGTAFDIAHNPILANPESLVKAINLAVKCTLNQRKA